MDPNILNQLEIDTNYLWRTDGEVLDDLVTDAKDSLPAITNYNSGGVWRTFLEIIARGIGAFYNLLQAVIQQSFVQTATGGWLDLKAGEVGLARLAATKTAGNITFYRAGTSGNVIIPLGAIVETPTDSKGRKYRFITTAQAVLAAGQTSVTAPAEAEFAGAEYNVGEQTVTKMVTSISGVTGCRNDSGWLTSEGADEEKDEPLRYRYRLKWEELARGSTKMAYVGYAMEVPGVAGVSVDDSWPRGQGTVDIYITGTAGMPTQTLLDAVQANVNEKKPICSDADVKAPTGVTVAGGITIYVYPGTTGQAAMATDAENIVNALFVADDTYPDCEQWRFRLGDDATQDRIILALNRYLTGIKRIDCGFTRIPVTVAQLAQKGTITITVTEEAS